MQRSSKQKSCFKCKSSKRRCDRTLPSCTRCIDHGVECAYPFSQDLSDRGSLDSRHSNSGRQKSFDAHSTSIQPRDAFGPEASSGIASSHQASGLSSSSAQAPTIVTLAKLHTLSGRELKWFTPPSTWVVVHHKSLQNSSADFRDGLSASRERGTTHSSTASCTRREKYQTVFKMPMLPLQSQLVALLKIKT